MTASILVSIALLVYCVILQVGYARLKEDHRKVKQERDIAKDEANAFIVKHMEFAVKQGWGTQRALGHNRTTFDWKQCPKFYDQNVTGNVLSFAGMKKSRPMTLALDVTEGEKEFPVDVAAIKQVVVGPTLGPDSTSRRARVIFKDNSSKTLVFTQSSLIALAEVAFKDL